MFTPKLKELSIIKQDKGYIPGDLEYDYSRLIGHVQRLSLQFEVFAILTRDKYLVVDG